MSIANQTAKAQYTADGINNEFIVPFKFFANSPSIGGQNYQIQVFIGRGGVDARLQENINYTVQRGAESKVIISNAYGGGEVPAAGDIVSILRDVYFKQGIELEENRRLPAKTLEEGFDKSMMGLQQHEEVLSRALVVPLTYEGSQHDFTDNIFAAASAAAKAAQVAQSEAENARAAADNAQAAAESAIADINTAESAAVVAVETARDGALGDILAHGSDIINEAQGYAAAAGEEANNADISAQNAAFYAEAAGETVFAVMQELDKKADKDLSNVEDSVVRAKANRVWRSPYFNYNALAWISFNHGLTAEELVNVKDIAVWAEIIATNPMNMPVGIRIKRPVISHTNSYPQVATAWFDDASVWTVISQSLNLYGTNFVSGGAGSISTTAASGYVRFWFEIIY